MCYKQKCKVVSLNLAHPVVALDTIIVLAYFLTYLLTYLQQCGIYQPDERGCVINFL